MNDAPAGAPATTIAVAGTGDDAELTARALLGAGGVEITRITGASDEELLDQLSRDDLDAIAFVTPAVDLAGSVRRALMSNRHALIVGPAALTENQLNSLEDLARRRSRVVYFDAGYAADERVAFVRKMTTAPASIWRTHYLRAVRTGTDRHTVDELAIAEIAAVLSIMGAAPSGVTGVAPRIDDETGHAGAVMLTMTFAGGPVATVDVSLVESMQRREIVIVCDGRTIVMDSFDVRAPLQIHAAGRHRGPQTGRAWSETVNEYPASAASADRLSAVAATFVSAVRARDVSVINLREFSLAATVWEAARESIALGGELRPVTHDGAPRPELQVIRGGGNTSPASQPPDLTLIARRNA